MLQQRSQIVSWLDEYVAFGLIARYQGANNTGAGHNPAAILWKDLVGNADLLLADGLRPGTRQWGVNYFESLKVSPTPFVWLSSPLPPNFTPESCTLEVVFVPYTGADTSGGGDIVGIDDIATAPYTTITLEMQGMNASFLVEERATFATVHRRAVTANTLYSVSMAISPYSAVPANNGYKAIYYNGVQQYRAARVAPLYVQFPTHYLSAASNPAIREITQIFYGRIYEIRLYNRPLSASEIARNAALDLQRYG